MQMYLNVIEMGPGIYGAEAASQYYFHKPAKKLSNAEAAAIAAEVDCPRLPETDEAFAAVDTRPYGLRAIAQVILPARLARGWAATSSTAPRR